MTRFSSMILLATLMVAHGHVEQTDSCASGMDDETCLIQTKVAMKKTPEANAGIRVAGRT
jgi:hypothetical protein